MARRNEFFDNDFNATVASIPGKVTEASLNYQRRDLASEELDGGLLRMDATEPMIDETDEQTQGETIIDAGTNVENTRATVGWLICVKGDLKGQDFRLHSGHNYIGRTVKGGTPWDINIPDRKVSSKGMARVTYDTKNRRFTTASHGTPENITYCNDEPLDAVSRPLVAYDRISVGDTDLIFIPLCGEHFIWED